MRRQDLPAHDHDVSTCPRCTHDRDVLGWLREELRRTMRRWNTLAMSWTDRERQYRANKARLYQALGHISSDGVQTIEHAKAWARFAFSRDAPEPPSKAY